MKTKSFLSLFLYCALSFPLFAITLPDGQEAAVSEYKQENGKLVAVKISAPVVVSTKYGDISLKNLSIVRWYESGALKSFVPASNMSVAMLCGTLSVKAVGSKNAIELHENGNLKSGTLAAAVEIKTSQGKMKTAMNKIITFYDDGSLESFYPASKQQISFFNDKFTAIYSVAALPVTYSTKHPLAFYKSGAVRSFAAVSSAAPKDIPLTLLPDTPITLSENGATVGGYPVDNATVAIGDATLLVVKGTQVSYYDNHSLKSATVDYTLKTCTVGDISFSGMDGGSELARARISLYEDGGLERVAVVEPENYANAAFGTTFGKKPVTVSLTVHGVPYQASSVDFFTDGTVRHIVYRPFVRVNERSETRKSDMIDPVTKKPKTYEVHWWFEKFQDYYAPDGRLLCSVGAEVYKDPRDMGFYSTTETVLYTYGLNGKVAQAVKGTFGTGTEVFFDEQYTPVSYRANDENPVTKIE